MIILSCSFKYVFFPLARAVENVRQEIDEPFCEPFDINTEEEFRNSHAKDEDTQW